ncbi:MAG: PKD domain-containing protein [Bacteroidetes bacterium]|nr:MAG: PKD domain-containing protein [Bacteroidota bacterium]
MKKITLIGITFLLALFVNVKTMNLHAQSCNQVEILYQSPECLEKRHGSAGLPGGSTCHEIAVCVNVPYTYSSSVTGAGWTFSWTVSGPTSVVINPNNTSANINIVWPQIGAYTLTLTATDGSANVFTYCLKVNVKDKPVANFTFSPNNVCEGSTIAFTNTTTFSGGGVAYSWDFGDPASGGNNFSTTTNPLHTYNAPGLYTVTLVAYSFTTSSSGQPTEPVSITACCSDTITMQVNIIPGSITIECISTVCAGDTATYTSVGCANPVWLPPIGGSILNQSGNNVTIIWGNGNPQGQIVAQCPGGCIATVSVPIIPTIPIIAGNASPCFNSSTSYSLPVLPGTFYNWTLTNISTATNYNSLLNTFPDNNTVWINWGVAPPGTYQLDINLTNNHLCCNSNGVLIINPTFPWEAYFDQTICTGAPGASLSVFPTLGTFNWTVLPPNAGVSPLSGTGPTFNPVFSNTGNYTIEVTETGNNYCNSGIANPQQIQVTVVGTPAPGTIIGPATICLGTDYSYAMSTNAPTGYHYEWSISAGAGSFMPGNLTTTTGNSSTIQWTSLPGTISVVLQRNGTPACPRPVTLNVAQATVGSISGPLSVCVDGTGTYNLSGGNLPAGEEITWSLAPPFSSMGTITSGQGTNSIVILWHGQAGIGPWGPVTINATTNCGSATALSGIMVNPKFGCSIVRTGLNVCQPGGVTLTVSGVPGGSTYLWSPGGQTTASISNITSPGTYIVTVTSGGCVTTCEYLVEDPFEIGPVTCSLGICTTADSTSEILGVQIIKPLTGTFTYQWYYGISPSGTLIPGANSATYTTLTHGNFYVAVTYGSCTKYVDYFVKKICCPNITNPQITSVVRNSCNSYTFTGTTNSLPPGTTITWSFGDGTTAPGASGVPINHTYTNAGDYCVSFCVGPPSPNPTNCTGNCDITSVTVPIEAAFTYTLGCNGCLNVTNISKVITSNPSFVTYFWDFGDGNTSVAANPGIHCYSVPGTYTVSLTITYNDGVFTCTSTATHIVNYTPLGINIIPTPVCTGISSAFSSTPGSFISYAWDFGDGFTAFTPSTTHIYNATGTYPVTLTVIDQLGNTCTASSSINVLPGIGPCSIQPAFICPGGTATLSTTNIVGYTYLWEEEISPNVFAPAPGINTNNTYTVTNPGFFRVLITGVNGCVCTTKKVEVKAVPQPKAIIAVAPSSNICGSGDVTLSSVNHLNGYTSDWYANGNYGTLLASGSVYMEFGVSTTTTYNLVLTNEYGCRDTCSILVTVNPIPNVPVITSSPTLCEGVPISLTVLNYSGDITWSTGASGTSITVFVAGTYVATYTDPVTGCTSSSNITVNRRPPVGLFPHYCDIIQCSCLNQQGEFTIYAPLPLVGNFASVYDIQWYFNNTPVGSNGPNPIFTPAVTGTYHIVITDPFTGCTDTSKTYSIVIPDCDLCDSTTCHVDLGNDTSICAGDVLTITALGCTGITKLYELGPNGPIPLGAGPIWDINPVQSTCYVVECCDSIPDLINGGNVLCCCTDTLCVTVNPLPILQWPTVYPDVCQNSDSIFLDASNILVFINPNWVPVTSTGGTGVFSGPGFIGNYFYPTTIGLHTIIYTYTDSLGCSDTITNTINVIFCCDTTCVVDAGPDITICQGQVATITVTGCTGTVTWAELNDNGGVAARSTSTIGTGFIFDVSPQITTCYVVTCCDTIFDPVGGYTLCCCSDTVCVFVNPLPQLQWPFVYPTVCQGSDSVFLDASAILVFQNPNWVPVTSTNGTGVFSGPGVIGNYFYPNTLGTFMITYTYTDSLGCSATVTNTINVIYCCDNSGCTVSAGSDTSICQGDVAVLTATGCTGTITWYMLGPNGPVPVGQGPVIDVQPAISTCYVVECCCPGPIVCCVTDTICITVNQKPRLQWQITFPSVCQNSDSIFLDASTILVFQNPNWVPVTSTNGTGVFSGPGVIGNYFYPTTLGTFVITYTYTDSLGCSASVFANITVIYCCDSNSCTVSAGPDLTICEGDVAVLTATSCNSTITWYKLDPNGPVVIGQGPIVDISPLQSECYIVECCCPGPIVCCVTDTVCVIVNEKPRLQWPVAFAPVCQNSDSVFLDASTILVYQNPNWVPVTSTNGTGAFSGPGVIGNYFYPTTLGTFVITYTYTDSLGCSASVFAAIQVIYCCDSTVCTVDAGPDITICQGETAILTADGCNGTIKWYMLGPIGPVLVGEGEILDVFPTQSTCYVVECCCPGPIVCCATDTVCVIVKPVPQLQWPVVYQDVCQSATPVVLDPSQILVFQNPNWVPVTSTNGSGFFSGIGVSGNFFTPSTLGTFTISYTYTDSAGCSSSIFNTINVIFCCDTNCVVSAGPDISICQGEAVILSASGCQGNVTWAILTPSGLDIIGEEPDMEVFPQTNTCYVVTCCCPGPVVCCKTDTVCVTVKPKPQLQWPISYVNVCKNSPPVLLNPGNIFVNINNTLVSVPFAPGTGYFSGSNVSLGYFYPNTVGSHVIYFNYTDTNGCVGVITNTITVIKCPCGPCHVPGFELIPNHSFSNGNTGFSSSLSASCICLPESYCIESDASRKCVDNIRVTSPDPASSLFMIVENPLPSMIWQTNVTIDSTERYEFSIQLHPDLHSGVSERPDLTITAGGVTLLTIHGSSMSSGWDEYAVQFTGVDAGSIEVIQTNSSGSGAKIVYGIGAISLKPCIPIVNIALASINNVTCFGGSNGSISVTASGGTAPYTYQWSNGSTTSSIFGLPAGTYTVTVTDSLGCKNKRTFIITQPAKLQGTAVSTPANCNVPNGTATVYPSGGTAPYSYLWSNGQSTQTATGLSPGLYSVSILDANGCVGTVNVTVSGTGFFPDVPGPISGPLGACRNQSGVVYSVAPASGASSYQWSLPAGASGVSTGTSITLNFSSSFNGGFLCVSAVNACGLSQSSCIYISVLSVKPSNPGIMIGPQYPCGPGLFTYMINPVINAQSYVWSVSGSGVAIISGQGSNSVVVSIPSGFGQGRVSVYARNCAGNSSQRDFTITGLAAHGNTLVGPSNVCAGASNVSYSIAPVNGASSYHWFVTSGDMSIASQNGTSCNVSFGSGWTTGQLSVATGSPCGSFIKTYTLFSAPAQPGSIFGPGTNLCLQQGVTYNINPVANATSYQWVVSPGINMVSNNGVSITVNFNATFTSTGTICVSAVNACGSSPVRCYTVFATPSLPAPINGPFGVCKSSSSQLYSITPVNGASHYSWYITGGGLITPLGNGVEALADFTNVTGTSVSLSVRSNNACGMSQPANKNLIVDQNCRSANLTDNSSVFVIYPNPSNGLVNTEFYSASDTDAEIIVYDIFGKIIRRKAWKLKVGLNNMEIDLGDSAPGVYLVSVQRSDEERKVIKLILH